MNKWYISDPRFECDSTNPALKFAYWEGHRSFAYDFVKFVSPKRIVELGSQYGCSLFSFCQSVKDFHLECEINAVDFWSGDIGAPDSGEEVFKLVNQIKEQYYSSLNVHLYQMGFDSAVDKFDDNSIDLLHIDGGHRFEDVDHDFNTWLPKLKENGVILFHDVYSNIDQGSCDHWAYIKTKYTCLFDFKHSCGLGVLFPKGDLLYRRLLETDFFPHVHDIYYHRSLYTYAHNRFLELSELYEKRFEAIQKQSEMIDERDRTISSQTKLIDDKDAAIASQTALIDERDETIRSQTKLIDDKDAAIASQAALIDERDETIRSQTKLIDDKDAAIASQAVLIDERDETIRSQTKLIDDKDAAIASQAALIDERDETIRSQTKLIDDKDAAIASQAVLIDERDETIQIQREFIEELKRTNAEVISKMNGISTLSGWLKFKKNKK